MSEQYSQDEQFEGTGRWRTNLCGWGAKRLSEHDGRRPLALADVIVVEGAVSEISTFGGVAWLTFVVQVIGRDSSLCLSHVSYVARQAKHSLVGIKNVYTRSGLSNRSTNLFLRFFQSLPFACFVPSFTFLVVSCWYFYCLAALHCSFHVSQIRFEQHAL